MTIPTAVIAYPSPHPPSFTLMGGMTPRATGRRFFGLLRPKLSLLAIRLDAIFGRDQKLHITKNSPSPL